MNEKNPADPTPSEGHGRDIYVGDYEGDRAGEALARVRRQGLKPHLQRVEGYDPKMQGLVVFQTPRPGNPAAPGSTVGLFIAAPPPPPAPATGTRLADTGTIETHELTSPPAKDAEESGRIKASIPPGTAGVWRGSPSARHSLRETIAGQLNTGMLLVWREALLAWWREHQPS